MKLPQTKNKKKAKNEITEYKSKDKKENAKRKLPPSNETLGEIQSNESVQPSTSY